ncbi:MAG: nucleotidyl transferase AbiEii/AbiGii toxin family protein [Anaerolineae bacterium]
MNEQECAAWELHAFLTRRNVSYVIIGGLAVQRWGEPRFTQDVDVTAVFPLDDPVPLLQELTAHFPARLPDAVDFARRNRVLLVRASNGVSLDISLGLPGYEEEVMARAVDWELEPGKVVRLCAAEDLIIHKAVAGRPQDLRDIEGIIYRQGPTLDPATIRRWLEAFAEVLAQPDLPERFETPWRKMLKFRSQST